ncbi:PREDICTED: uncharacterized protein LOC107069190 [Polistes dominula]|uniref:Uncharacterized protein LOC107069190 n=1 Tax=Polistes dominula TaxID=743375 RepID=A0ABM1INH1_POLDO|nr:PREDICTED: uncharacterized protein LOC107069190 [Polistes dominula]
MTSHLNQDQLEKYFGIMRSIYRCNDHPDTILFGQVFRLLCSYSLVTPPKGSNVTACELLQSLMQTKESLIVSNSLKKNWLNDIDAIIENGIVNHENSCSENINEFVGTKTIKINTVNQILEKISKAKFLPMLGCDKHVKELMAKILNNFIIMRGNFLVNLINRTLNDRKLKTKKLRKYSKLS